MSARSSLGEKLTPRARVLIGVILALGIAGGYYYKRLKPRVAGIRALASALPALETKARSAPPPRQVLAAAEELAGLRKANRRAIGTAPRAKEGPEEAFLALLDGQIQAAGAKLRSRTRPGEKVPRKGARPNLANMPPWMRQRLRHAAAGSAGPSRHSGRKTNGKAATTPRDDKLPAGVSVKRYQVSVIGDYASILGLLERLERMPTPFRLEKTVFSRRDDEDGSGSVSLELDLAAFLPGE